ncbi:hypothetical protein GGI07_004483 [Coemansia sp. Benny D115]|nr:hypothetical protein GGI07_004483 [Coemansia sp. Benny D115]
MKFAFSTFVAATLSVITVQGAAVRGLTDPTLYVFGDSLSDIGALKQMTLGLIPPQPYWEGRFSSGPVWNEYTAKLLGYNLYNKALGGSTTDNKQTTLVDILGINIPSTQDQINYFKFTRPLYSLDFTRNKDVAVLEVGPNDYFSQLPNLKSGAVSVDTFVNTLSTTVVSQLEQLRKIGFKNIIVSNLPTIQYTPMATHDDVVALTNHTVTLYNQAMATKTNSWASSASGVNYVAICDLGKFVEITIQSQAILNALGLTDTTTTCIQGLATDSLAGIINSILNSSSNPLCADPGARYFFDDIHPAERIHRLYGYVAKEIASASFQGKTFDVTEASLLNLISKYNLGSAVAKPVAI